MNKTSTSVSIAAMLAAFKSNALRIGVPLAATMTLPDFPLSEIAPRRPARSAGDPGRTRATITPSGSHRDGFIVRNDADTSLVSASLRCVSTAWRR
jgi:hypothetical protein